MGENYALSLCRFGFPYVPFLSRHQRLEMKAPRGNFACGKVSTAAGIFKWQGLPSHVVSGTLDFPNRLLRFPVETTPRRRPTLNSLHLDTSLPRRVREPIFILCKK